MEAVEVSDAARCMRLEIAMTKQEPDAAKKPLPTPNDEAGRLALAAQLNTVLGVAEVAAERELEQAKAALDSDYPKKERPTD